MGLRTALGNLRVYGQPPGESKTPSPTSRTSEQRPTASSLATRSEGSGVRHPQPAAGSTGDWRAGPGPLRGLLGPSGLTYVVAGLQASTRTTSGAPAGPGCQQEGSGSSPAAPVARGRGRLEPPPQPDLWPHGERHTPPRPSRSPRAAAIAGHFLLPTGGGGPKRASPRPSHPPDSSQQPQRVQSPAPEVEETRSRAGGEPALLPVGEARAQMFSAPTPFVCAQCPPARAGRDPSAHAAGRAVSLLAHAGPPSHLRRVHPQPARVTQRETLPSCSGRAGAHVPALAGALSPGTGRARPHFPARATWHELSFLAHAGPHEPLCPGARYQPSPVRAWRVATLHVLSAPGLLPPAGQNPTCCPRGTARAARRPALCWANPSPGARGVSIPVPFLLARRSTAQAPRVQRARREHPVSCASGPSLPEARTARVPPT